MLQYLPALNAAGFDVHVQSLFDDQQLANRYQRGSYGLATITSCYKNRVLALLKRRQYDLVWIEKEALPWWPFWSEKLLLSGTPYVLDFDDAVFHHYDRHRLAAIRLFYGKRIDKLMAGAALVVCGNDYLAERARHAGASLVQVLPTVIDLDRYRMTERVKGSQPRIVWIGSPSTVKYLDLLREPLQALAQTTPFVFRVIGGDFSLPGVQTECLPWTESTEITDLMACDIGVMPLQDTPWERGKCGYKLIQYMACGLPVIASPVGVNAAIVDDGHNGYLARDASQWIDSFSRLLSDEQTSQTMGQMGRVKVEKQYCLQVTAPRLVQWFRNLL